MNSNTTEAKLFTTLGDLPLVDVSVWDTVDNLPIANRAEFEKMLGLKESNRFNDVVIKCQQNEQVENEVPPILVPSEKDTETDDFLADLKLMQIHMFGLQEIGTPIAQAQSATDVFGEEAAAMSRKENKGALVPKLKLQQQQQQQKQSETKAKPNNLRLYEQKQSVKRQHTFDVDKLKGARRQSATDMRSSAGTTMPPALISNMRTNSTVNRKPVRSMSTISTLAKASDTNLDDIVKQIGNLFVKLQSSKQRHVVGGVSASRRQQSSRVSHAAPKNTSYVVTVHDQANKAPRCVIHAISDTTMKALESATTSPSAATAAATIAAVSTAASSIDADDQDLVYVNNRSSDTATAIAAGLEPMDLGETVPQPTINYGIPTITIFSPGARGQNNHFNATGFTRVEADASTRQLDATKSDTNLTNTAKSISYLKMPQSYYYSQQPPK